jgi:hypothetical protein
MVLRRGSVTVVRTAYDIAADDVFVIDQRDVPPRRGRHRRRPARLLGGWGALALCGATALAATAVVLWTGGALPAPFEVPEGFSGPGASGSPALELEFEEPAADAVPDGPDAGDEPGAGPDPVDPGAYEKLPR